MSTLLTVGRQFDFCAACGVPQDVEIAAWGPRNRLTIKLCGKCWFPGYQQTDLVSALVTWINLGRGQA